MLFRSYRSSEIYKNKLFSQINQVFIDFTTPIQIFKNKRVFLLFLLIPTQIFKNIKQSKNEVTGIGAIEVLFKGMK